MKKKIIICIDLLSENGYNMSFIFNVVISFNTLDRCPFKYELYRRFKIIYSLKVHEHIFNNEYDEISASTYGRKCQDDSIAH